MSPLPTAARYTFAPLDEAGFQIYCNWYVSDPDSVWISPPTRQWFEYLHNTPSAHAWLVRDEDGRGLGLVQLDEYAEQQGGLMLYVAPDARRRGHGRGMLRALLARPELGRLRVIVGGIDPKNVASLRCVLGAGFVLTSPEPDAEGLLNVAYRLPEIDF